MAKTRECEGFAEDYSALLDGELEAGRAVQMRAHVEGCAYCEAELQALRNVDAMLRAAPAPEVPSDLHARLRARIAAENSRPLSEVQPCECSNQEIAGRPHPRRHAHGIDRATRASGSGPRSGSAPPRLSRRVSR